MVVAVIVGVVVVVFGGGGGGGGGGGVVGVVVVVVAVDEVENSADKWFINKRVNGCHIALQLSQKYGPSSRFKCFTASKESNNYFIIFDK